MIEKVLCALKSTKGGNNTANHIRRTFISGATASRIERDGLSGDEALWRLVSYARPVGSAGNLARIGAMALVAGAGGSWGATDSLADAIATAADAMRLELGVRYREPPRKGGIVEVANAMAVAVRRFGLGREAIEFARNSTRLERHPDDGAEFVFSFLENLLEAK